MRSEDMLNYLPTYERKSKVFQELFNTFGVELDQKVTEIDDIEKQLSIDTATWGLDIYEKELALTTDPNKPLEERRSVVKSKWRGTGKVDAVLIKMVADAFTNGGVTVGFTGKIKVTFNDVKGVPPNIQDVYKSVEGIKPAHLAIVYIFTWLTWNEFDIYNKAWDEWDALNLTWDEFETYREVV